VECCAIRAKTIIHEIPAQLPENIMANWWKEMLPKRFCCAAAEFSFNMRENQGSNDDIRRTIGQRRLRRTSVI
jgi:hypothetical protein